MPTLIEISEREVIEKAKAWAREGDAFAENSVTDLFAAALLLVERERMAAEMSAAGDTKHEFTLHGDGDGSGIHNQIARARNATSNEEENHAPAVRVPPFRFGDREHHPISRTRKLSRREQEIEKRRRSDPLGQDRDDIDYSSDELPSVR